MVSHPNARARSRARSAGESDVDEETLTAQETNDALASARGAGERPAAAAAGDTSRGHGRRGRDPGSRTAAAALGNWSEAGDLSGDLSSVAGDLSSTSHIVVWTPAERQLFAARGGVSAAAACSISSTVSSTLDPDEALNVSEDAVQALLGRGQAVLLRMSGLPMQREREKEWKVHRAQAAAGPQGAGCGTEGPGRAT